jgi:heterodisulfide reductase subunit B
MSKYLFYPGCSLQRSARPYLDSLMAIRPLIDMDVEEIQDWNCCGATEYVAVHNLAAHALIGRNLALAEQQANGSRTVMAACSACYLNLAKTDSYMQHSPRLAEQVNDALAAGNMHYTPGSVRVRHLLDLIVNDIGLDKVINKIVRPLKGLRVAPYYGCMIARPDHDNRWDNVEHPVAMDKLLTALGVEVIDFPLKTHCCGGHMTQINIPVAYDLIRRLVHAATEYRADVMVVLCPMCQLNLDAYQAEVNRYFHTDYHMPVLYFTQLMGLAFGLDPDELGIGKEFVTAQAVLKTIGLEAPADGQEQEAVPTPTRHKKPRRAKEALPMPQMSGSEEEIT